eukprot:COSAG04_NODE_16051_length_511_cov_1.002427_1_plen_117_part_10
MGLARSAVSRDALLSLSLSLSLASVLLPFSTASIVCASRDKSGAEIQGGKHLPTGVQLATNHYQNSNAWLEGTCTFVAEPLATAFRVYAGQTAGTGGGYVNPSKGEHGRLQSTLLAG